MKNGTLTVTATGNAVTAALKTQAGADPSAGDPVIVSFLDRAGGYREVGITAPLSTTIAQGVTGGAPSLLPFRGWWHLVDGPAPQIGFAVYTGPSRILKPRDGGIINTAAPGNNPFSVYTPSAVSNASARVIGCSTWEGGLPVAGQWSAPSNTDLWFPGMLLPLDVIDGLQTSTPVNQFLVNATPGQWYDTGFSQSLALKSAANAVQSDWCGNALGSSSGDEVMAGLYRNNAIHVGSLHKVNTSAGYIVAPVGGPWLDFPATLSVSYNVKIKSWLGGNISFSYGSLGNGANGQPVMQLAEVMT